MFNGNIKILIASHKSCCFPKLSIYYPIWVGRENKSEEDVLDFSYCDNNGDNISHKNNSYCELTAFYYMWKNNLYNDDDIIGLVHYRRYFKGDFPFDINNTRKILSEKQIIDYLSKYQCIVPKKRYYIIETVYSHYKNAHYIKDLDTTRQVIEDLYPSYLTTFDKVMKHRSLYLYNMFIMRGELCNKYFQWLFDILFELENRIDISDYSLYQKRVFGFLSERLFNVFVYANKLNVIEIGVTNLDNISLAKKCYFFLKRKFFPKNKL